MKKKLFCLILSLCMLVSLFAGCGQETASAPPEEVSSPAEESVPAVEAPAVEEEVGE